VPSTTSLLPGAMEIWEPVIWIGVRPRASSSRRSVPVSASCNPRPAELVPCSQNCEPCAVKVPFTSSVPPHTVAPEEIVNPQLFAPAEPTVKLPA
jgi:hypothetical protein